MYEYGLERLAWIYFCNLFRRGEHSPPPAEWLERSFWRVRSAGSIPRVTDKIFFSSRGKQTINKITKPPDQFGHYTSCGCESTVFDIPTREKTTPFSMQSVGQKSTQKPPGTFINCFVR